MMPRRYVVCALGASLLLLVVAHAARIGEFDSSVSVHLAPEESPFEDFITEPSSTPQYTTESDSTDFRFASQSQVPAPPTQTQGQAPPPPPQQQAPAPAPVPGPAPAAPAQGQAPAPAPAPAPALAPAPAPAQNGTTQNQTKPVGPLVPVNDTELDLEAQARAILQDPEELKRRLESLQKKFSILKDADLQSTITAQTESKNAKTWGPKRRLMYDSAGRLCIFGLNADDQLLPVFVTAEGFVAPQRDTAGQYVVRNVGSNATATILLKSDGKPVFTVNDAGKPYVLDSNRTIVLLHLNKAGAIDTPHDDIGRPVYFDRFGNPFRIDITEDGYPRVDRDSLGRPLVLKRSVPVVRGNMTAIVTTADGKPVVDKDVYGNRFVRDAGTKERLTPFVNQTSGEIEFEKDSANRTAIRPVVEFDLSGRVLKRDDANRAFVQDDTNNRVPALIDVPMTIPSVLNLMPGVTIDGKKIEGGDSVQLHIAGQDYTVVKVKGLQGPTGPQGPKGEDGKNATLPANLTAEIKRELEDLKHKMRTLQGASTQIIRLEQAVFPDWATSLDSCPDKWIRLGFVEQEKRVHCAPPIGAETPGNPACNVVAKFPRYYDRCGWSIHCRAPWKRFGCYPMGVGSDAPVFRPNDTTSVQQRAAQVAERADADLDAEDESLEKELRQGSQGAKKPQGPQGPQGSEQKPSASIRSVLEGGSGSGSAAHMKRFRTKIAGTVANQNNDNNNNEGDESRNGVTDILGKLAHRLEEFNKGLAKPTAGEEKYVNLDPLTMTYVGTTTEMDRAKALVAQILSDHTSDLSAKADAAAASSVPFPLVRADLKAELAANDWGASTTAAFVETGMNVKAAAGTRSSVDSQGADHIRRLMSALNTLETGSNRAGGQRAFNPIVDQDVTSDHFTYPSFDMNAINGNSATAPTVKLQDKAEDPQQSPQLYTRNDPFSSTEFGLPELPGEFVPPAFVAAPVAPPAFDRKLPEF